MEIENSSQRSKHIKKAVNLLCVSLVIRYIEIITSFFIFGNDITHGDLFKVFSFSFSIKYYFVSLAINIFLVLKILKGSKDAKTIFFIFAVIGIILSISSMPSFSNRSIFTIVLFAARAGLQIYAFILLLMPSAKSFFPSEYSYLFNIPSNRPPSKGPKAFLFFIISFFFAYAGIVNLGGTGFFFMTPFLFYLVFISRDKTYGLPSRIFLVILFALYVLKHLQIPVFYPAIGRSFYLNRDVCLEEHKLEHSTIIWMSWLVEDRACTISEREGIIKVMKMPKGTKLIISGTKVETDWFREHYVFLAQTPLGELEHDPSRYPEDRKLAVWHDGKSIKQSDLFREIFYTPSQVISIFR